jgi:F0F1-type ATP synthase membrane subunit c/vacuolar-type H+-ATPase subunit K
MGRQPAEIAKLQTAMIIIGAFAEALTIYAFVTVFLLMGKIA